MPQRARTDSQECQNADDYDFRARHQLVLWYCVGAYTVNEDDTLHAICFPTSGWPPCEVLHTDGEAETRLERHVFDEANFRNVPLTHSFT